MPSPRIHQSQKDKIYFLTFTVKNWYYIFDRHNRFAILADSINWCQVNKGLKVYAYVFMLNHIHLIASAPDTSAVVRDFKSFTSKELIKNIIATEPNILPLFKEKNGYSLWRDNNYPEAVESEKFFRQKMEYICNNPVRKQYVASPEQWFWSSANTSQHYIKIDSLF